MFYTNFAFRFSRSNLLVFNVFFCWSLGHFDYTFPCFFVCFSKLISFLTFACVCGDELEGLSNTLLNGTCLFQQERREKRLVTHAGEMKTNFADFCFVLWKIMTTRQRR